MRNREELLAVLREIERMALGDGLDEWDDHIRRTGRGK